MKIAESWLREWVDVPLDTAEIGEQLTMIGHELDGLTREGEGLKGVVVAEVLEATAHPDADRLRICRVATGTGEPVQVVCGAPNARAGIKSPLAVPGCRLPNGLELRRAEIRGIESEGMLCSASELRLGEDADGIIELSPDAVVGQPLADYLGLPDAVFDVDLTPNRGDCFSVLGIARDLAARTGTPLAGPAMQAVPATGDAAHPVELVDADACPRFAARVVRGMDARAKSPDWMTERLRRCGIRTIHPVVDVTNYVMLELGQPLHAYDLRKLSGAIRPRFARAGEHLVLLDERDVPLRDDTVVVTDDTGPIGLAGIMGGLRTAVSATTEDVFLEAAFWPQQVIAGRARHYGLHTDASLRFERGVDPELPPRAIARATELLVGIAGGRAGPAADHQHSDRLPRRTPVRLRRARLDKLLGTAIEPHTVSNILQGLQLDAKADDDGWNVTPPDFRFDIVIEEDLVEEVARMYGYDRIGEATARMETPLVPVTEKVVDTDRVANVLLARDYQEVITWSFIDAAANSALTGTPSALELSNPISSELAVMRGTLWAGLLQVAVGNLARQQERVRLFEFGKSYHGTLDATEEIPRIAGLALGPVLPEQWGAKPQLVDFFDIKADVVALLATTGEPEAFAFEPVNHPALQPGQAARITRNGEAAGVLGKLHPAVARRLDMKKDVFLFELNADVVLPAKVPAVTPVSRFPAIRRDIAVVVGESVSARQLRDAVASVAPELVRDVRVFDVYRGPGIEAGLKSVALGLILQETSRTLTDADADSVLDAAVQILQQKFTAVLRD